MVNTKTSQVRYMETDENGRILRVSDNPVLGPWTEIMSKNVRLIDELDASWTAYRVAVLHIGLELDGLDPEGDIEMDLQLMELDSELRVERVITDQLQRQGYEDTQENRDMMAVKLQEFVQQGGDLRELDPWEQQ